MPSPFPGMDPFLEEFWGDIHASLVIYARDELQRHLPGDLRARVEERVFVDAPDLGERNVYPDVRIVERGRHSAVTLAAPAAVTDVIEPLVIHFDSEAMTETFIEIIDIGSGRRVVTVIEILSPANKRPGEGQRLYIKKQREMIRGKVNLVEIDLLRAGKSVLSIEESRIPPSHLTPYRIVVRRGWRLNQAELYAVRLQQRLPAIRIPLRQSDADVRLDLQPLLDRCYDNGAYQNDIDYEFGPEPPLSDEDAAWADELLREKGYRRTPAQSKRSRKRRK